MSQRLIDAEKLKKHYAWWDDDERRNLFDQIVDVQPTVDAEPHWIPCSERLPEKNGYYLTTTCYRQVYCDVWNEDHFDRTEMVIAWMPMPKPYEVEE